MKIFARLSKCVVCEILMMFYTDRNDLKLNYGV
jgi:hypothetical protein